ncbi:MAG: cryptochrome/photolyase family protein, partial [Peristeroidobacter soli]
MGDVENRLPITVTAAAMPGLLVLGNQLFPPGLLRQNTHLPVFMAEDRGLCTHVRHHRQKIVLFFAAMRAYRDELALRGFDVHYETLQGDYETRLLAWMRSRKLNALRLWEIEDKFFEKRIREFAAAHGFDLEFLPSPMFLTTRAEFREWRAGRRLHMADFYRWQRLRLGVLVDSRGRPLGRRWSFDEENRKRLPRTVAIPLLRPAAPTGHVRDAIEIVRREFGAHPGELDAHEWWLPTTRAQALAHLEDFLEHRLESFGPYEDALSDRDPFLFHSALTPALNLGLITPREVLDHTLQAAERRRVPIESVEGFVRQIIGWREFIRGVYQECSEQQEQANYFGHHR